MGAPQEAGRPLRPPEGWKGLEGVRIEAKGESLGGMEAVGGWGLEGCQGGGAR